MRILLTGANGFLGKHLVKKLETHSSIELYKVVRNKNNSDNKEISCDLTDINKVEKMLCQIIPDMVVHAAAFVPKTQIDYENNLSLNNLLMVRNLLSFTCNKFLNISSMTVYGASEKITRSELDHLSPETIYGESKLDVENFLNSLTTPSLSVRLPGLFGLERQSGLVFNTFQALNLKQIPSLPLKPLIWAAMDVRDAADSIVKIILDFAYTNYDQKAINVGYSCTYSINNLIEICEEIFNERVHYEIKHPEFAFDLNFLDRLQAVPEKNLKEALQELKVEYGFK